MFVHAANNRQLILGHSKILQNSLKAACLKIDKYYLINRL